NSGAFGFNEDAKPQAVGWIGPDDPTIAAPARSLTVHISEPFEQNLSRLLIRAWRENFPGTAWLMPMSHWAFELGFGSREWLPQALEEIAIDPQLLQARNDAAAIEFAERDALALQNFVTTLLKGLMASDFAIAFPHRPVLCTVHHHKQLWWTTAQPSIAAALRQMEL